MSFKSYLALTLWIWMTVFYIVVTVIPIEPDLIHPWYVVVGDQKAPRLDPAAGAILPQNAIKEGLGFCSRHSPHGVIGSWQPSRDQIDQLEADLARFLPLGDSLSFNRYPEPWSAHPPLHAYRRQYMGLYLLGDRPVILVNGITPTRSYGDLLQVANRWQREFIEVCDGGTSFYSVEYDPVRRAFRAFTYDGSA